MRRLCGTSDIKEWFWRCVREDMDDAIRSKLLAFWSGSPFPPMFGFDPALNDPDVRPMPALAYHMAERTAPVPGGTPPSRFVPVCGRVAHAVCPVHALARDERRLDPLADSRNMVRRASCGCCSCVAGVHCCFVRACPTPASWLASILTTRGWWFACNNCMNGARWSHDAWHEGMYSGKSLFLPAYYSSYEVLRDALLKAVTLGETGYSFA